MNFWPFKRKEKIVVVEVRESEALVIAVALLSAALIVHLVMHLVEENNI